MVRYCCTILLGAFLLFQVQPQIARTILPWFGGGAAVWSTCMLFFQVLLLGGYAYAHLLSRRLPPGKQAVLHIGLLAASFYFLPVTPAAHWQPTGSENPSLHILVLLTATVGFPYLLLAATGPLLQSWFSREFEGRSPYRLYALSNVGSLAALLSFPFVFEPNVSIGIQANVWAFAYLAFAGMCAVCAYTTARAYAISLESSPSKLLPKLKPLYPESVSELAPPRDHGHGRATEPVMAFSSSGLGSGGSGGVAVASPPARTTSASASAPTRLAPPPLLTTPEPIPTPGARQKLSWVALAALPSVMLLAVTNAICQDVAVMPFFWVLPLSLYLVTFILTFESDRWYVRPVLVPLLGTAALALFLIPPSWFMDSLAPQVALLCAGLFFCGMLCHGELARSRPAPSHLTAFYLLVSLGGALGGVFVALVAPVIFNTFLEVELSLVGCAIAATYAAFRITARPWIRKVFRFALPAALVAGLALGTWWRIEDRPDYLEQHRNFFGTLNVQSKITIARGNRTDTLKTVSLVHGSTVHGRQMKGRGLQEGAGMTYYWPGTGVAHAIRNHPKAASRPLHIGLVGLGAGTLAHYARKGDHFSYFEIDPDIERVAEAHFSYLKDARDRGATVDVTIGDARIQLERELENGGRDFDVLVVDAFSSDAIPVHLLTKECNEVYWKHLAKDGILAIHVSNRHLDLAPVVRGLAKDANKELRIIEASPKDLPGATPSVWILVTDNAGYLQRAELAVKPGPAQPSRLWTDDFSSLWHVLK